MTSSTLPAGPQGDPHSSPAPASAGGQARLRPAMADDTPALLELAVSTNLFKADELDALSAILASHHVEETPNLLHVWCDETSDKPVGVVYVGPNQMADRTWDLLWIAVAPERQGQGIGGDLIRLAEQAVRAGDGRILIIETGSLPKFDATHGFYRAHGFVEVARIPDFYADDDSKVVFWKRIATPS